MHIYYRRGNMSNRDEFVKRVCGYPYEDKEYSEELLGIRTLVAKSKEEKMNQEGLDLLDALLAVGAIPESQYNYLTDYLLADESTKTVEIHRFLEDRGLS